MAKLYLDDLEVGQRFVSGTHTLRRRRHDPVRRGIRPATVPSRRCGGGETLFGGLVASGWHTAVTMMRLILDGGLPIAVGTGGELMRTAPVRPGDTLRVECEVLEITPSRSKPDRGTVKLRCLTKNQNGATVQCFTPKLIVPRRPC
jgi:acyl dehydratase